MAIDKDAIVRQTDPYDYWISDDWSVTSDKKQDKLRQVKVIDVVYGDGQRATLVLDEKGQPFTHRALRSLSPDKTQADLYAKEQAAGQRGDQEGDTRGPQTGPTREVYRGGKWVVEPNPVYQDPNGGGWHTEGTPDGQGGFDNTRPIMVRTVNGKREERSLSEDELRKWRADQQANQPQTGSDEGPVEGYPGWVKITRKKVEGGNSTTVTVYRGPDGKEVPTLPDKPQTAQPVPNPNGDGTYGWWETKPGQSPVWHPIAGGPQATPKPELVNGVYGVWKPGQNGAAPTFEPLPNQPGQVNLPPDAPQIDTTDENTAHESWLKLYQWVDAKVRNGQYTPEQATRILTGPHQVTQQIIARAKEKRDQQQALVNQQLTQRSQDISRSGTALTNSTSQFSNALKSAEETGKLVGAGSNATANTLFGNLALQKMFSGQMGGLDEPAPVVPGPMANMGAPVKPVPGAPEAIAAAQAAATGVTGTLPNGMTPAQAAAVEQRQRAVQNAGGVLPPPVFRPQAPAGQSEIMLDPTKYGAPPPPMSNDMIRPRMDQAMAFDRTPTGVYDGFPMPEFAGPTMAMASSMSGGADPYEGARASLRALGLSDEAIEEGLRGHLSGGMY